MSKSEQFRELARHLALISTSRRPNPVPASVTALNDAADRLEAVEALFVEIELMLPQIKEGCRALAQHHRHYNTSKSEQRLERLANKWQDFSSRLGTLNKKLKHQRLINYYEQGAGT